MRLIALLLVLFTIYYGTFGSMRFGRSLGGNVQASKPKYLDIEGWKECVESKQSGGAHEVWCFPEQKPADCDQSAWDQLKALQENESPQNCSSIS